MSPKTTTGVSVGPAVATGSPQALEEVLALTRRLRLPYLRKAAVEVIPTARAQRWDPAEVLRVLLTEESTGRDEATIRLRRKKANFPAGKTFDAWDTDRCSIPAPAQQALRTLEWVDRHENLCVCGPSGTGKSHFCEALGQAAIDSGRTVAWFGIDELGAPWSADTAPTTRSPKRSGGSPASTSSSSTTSACCPSAKTPPKGSTAWSTPATRNAHWPSAATCTRPGSTNSCPKPSPPPPSTDYSTTPTSASPTASPTDSPKPPPARG